MCIKQVLGASSLFLEGYHFAFSSFFPFPFSIAMVKRKYMLLLGKDLGSLGSGKMFYLPVPSGNLGGLENIEMA